MRMADQYFLSIKELGQETDARMKVIEEKLTQLRTTNTNLQTQNTSLQTEKNQLQLGSANLQTQISNLELMLLQQSKASSGGGGGEKDCVAEINKYHQYKGSIIKQAGTMQLTLATINNELKSMDGFFGIGKNKSEKEKIKQALEQLAKSIEAVSK